MGPIPKRDSERVRRNKPDVPTLRIIPGEGGKVEAPIFLPENPHPLVIDFYVAMQNSPQAQYFQPTDWYYAQYYLTLMNEQLHRSGAKNGQILAVIEKGLANLLVSEGERRRLRIEVETNDPKAEQDSTVEYLNKILGI